MTSANIVQRITVISEYCNTYSMSSAHTCQKFGHAYVQRQLEWGYTVAVHSMYIRAMFGQHVRILDRPISRCAALLLPPRRMMQRGARMIILRIHLGTVVEDQLHDLQLIAKIERTRGPGLQRNFSPTVLEVDVGARARVAVGRFRA